MKETQQSFKKEIALEEAEKISNELITRLEQYTDRMVTVGSIRRRRTTVHDIDIVAIPKPYFFNKGVLYLPDVKVLRKGEKVISFIFKGVQVDIYLANNETFETIRLIRTGSIEHNKKLCMLAKEKGYHLYASGQGLYNGINKISDTEEGILIALLGKNIGPEEREK